MEEIAVDSSKIARVYSGRYGGRQWIVVAKAPIAPGEVLAEWDGERSYYDPRALDPVSDSFFVHRIQVTADDERGGHYVLDSTGLARYINHSCDPNCGLQGVQIVSRRHIVADEEVTWDYAMSELRDDYVFMEVGRHCQCQTNRCRGAYLGFGSLVTRYPGVVAEYKTAGFIASWLLQLEEEIRSGSV